VKTSAETVTCGNGKNKGIKAGKEVQEVTQLFHLAIIAARPHFSPSELLTPISRDLHTRK